MDIGQIIRTARKAKKISLEDLALQVGSDSGNLSRLERGKQSTTPEKLKQIMSILDIELSSYVQGPGMAQESQENVSPVQQPKRSSTEYPLISWVQAGDMTDSPSRIDDNVKWIGSTENAGDEGYWLEVTGHSMTCAGNPTFPEGSLILIKPGAPIINGKYYVVELMDSGEKTFKQYVEDAGYKYLRPLNTTYRTIEINHHCRFLGRVIDTRMTGL